VPLVEKEHAIAPSTEMGGVGEVKVLRNLRGARLEEIQLLVHRKVYDNVVVEFNDQCDSNEHCEGRAVLPSSSRNKVKEFGWSN